MADTTKGITKQGPQGLSIGEHFVQAVGGPLGWFLSTVADLSKDPEERYNSRGAQYAAGSYLLYGHPLNMISEREDMGLLSPRAGFIYNLENSVAKEHAAPFKNADARAAQTHRNIVNYTGDSLFIDEHELKGNKSGIVTKTLPYAERMESLKWLITDFGLDPNRYIGIAARTDPKLADWLLEKGGADINHVFKKGDKRDLPVEGYNPYLMRMRELMNQAPTLKDKIEQGKPKDPSIFEVAYRDAKGSITAAIYADPAMKFIQAKGGGITPEAKAGAAELIYQSRITAGMGDPFVKGSPKDLDVHQPYYDVMQREGLKNGVNVFASPKLLDQAIQMYKNASPGLALQAEAKTYYRGIMEEGYKTVTPAALDEVVSHWKDQRNLNKGGRPDTLSALIQEGRLSKDQLTDVSKRIENEPGKESTIAALNRALDGYNQGKPPAGLPDFMGGKRDRTGAEFAMGMQ